MPFHVQPLSIHCHAPVARGAHVCFGISPFNSYFTPQRIIDLARWGFAEFDAAHFFVPDLPAAYTLEALGYPPARAAHKARRQGQYVRNKIARALTDVGVHEPQRLILGWAELYSNPRYRHLRDQAQRLFDHDPDFRAECVEASRWVLENRLPAGGAATDDQLRSAVRYLLAELPLFTDTGAIVGAESSVFCYHQSIGFLQRLYHGELAWKPAEGQGFGVLTEVAYAQG
ncbi:tRNA-dependent cyclodipeptide synthase [Nocardia ninae]|uniref:Cyclodipeptide synthase n=1 Tax=Nocardia ninae NBRC 108245 TaxID=1210091 RepID=A0A511M9U5_9NOCA|nr:tRNA-dependent cyclodipeptide synthase [Nocardia ninae]GEM36496.1 cyclo(L-tyrosyl-L-tyrosyl) synthase [Nocardia ninae NBRC 108245]